MCRLKLRASLALLVVAVMTALTEIAHKERKT
jgi:hypothetical protein